MNDTLSLNKDARMLEYRLHDYEKRAEKLDLTDRLKWNPVLQILRGAAGIIEHLPPLPPDLPRRQCSSTFVRSPRPGLPSFHRERENRPWRPKAEDPTRLLTGCNRAFGSSSEPSQQRGPRTTDPAALSGARSTVSADNPCSIGALAPTLAGGRARTMPGLPQCL
jgi:hypothetical protein